MPKAFFRGGVFHPERIALGQALRPPPCQRQYCAAAMCNGQSLHLQYRAGAPLWSLSGGKAVPAEVAEILTKHASVVPAGGALFDGMPGQTWRFVP
jgi:hypothetical protein